MNKENIVRVKSYDFAKRIINLYKFLCSEKKEYILSKQILRSGTSIGANIVEAECGVSRKDFVAKMYIAFKESAETSYWLDLLYETDYIEENAFISMKGDCDELIKLLSAITKTTKETINS